MEMNIKNETLPVCSTVCRTKNNFSAECDVIVPDTKPDILTVLQLSALPKVTSCETRNGHVIVSGSISFDILYLADDEEKCVKSITSSCEFSNLVRDSNITESMLTFADVDVRDLKCNVANCRKLSLKATLCMSACVYSCMNLDVITGIEGACTKTTKLSTDVICAHSQDSTVITDSFTLAPDKAPVIEILKTDALVTDHNLKVIDDKAIMKGTLRVTILYRSESGIEYAQTEVSFAHILEAEGNRDDMEFEHKVKLTDISAAASVNPEGKKCVIDISSELDLRVIARRNVCVDCVEDAYIPHGAIECKTSPVSMDKVETVIGRDADFREKVTLPDSLPPIETIYQIIARPFTESCITEGGKLKISGYTEVYLLYLSSDKEAPACSYKANIDFMVESESPGCMLTPVALCKLNNISYTINDERVVELRGSFDVEVECIRTTEADIIYSVEPCDYTPPSRPSIIVSCVHSGRTLWDIAKEYSVSPEDILAANALENEAALHSGAALIIPK